MVTSAAPLKSDEDRKPEAQGAVIKEIRIAVEKGAFDPTMVHDWSEVRRLQPSATVGASMLILGRKDSVCEEEHWACKGRLALHGVRIHAADGARIFGAPDDLYGKPAAMGLARAIIAASTLWGWRVEADDIEGA